jgi:ATP dependent DNA ligase-like protein
MQCLPVAKLPEGPNWEYEVKFDGYRALGIKSGGRVRLMSRNENDLAARFPILTRALANIPTKPSSIQNYAIEADAWFELARWARPAIHLATCPPTGETREKRISSKTIDIE